MVVKWRGRIHYPSSPQREKDYGRFAVCEFGRDEGEFVWHHMKNLAVVLSAARNHDILW